eukprot:CAMPEP_0196721676 /NCGR_PEP_ID=MMETSP1091-20130531/4174_1 /TAXON_ID=302021 /ORGANISM="Rhodomonas sp., Strain CCMP768" /LENGTH=54 /DNA_ID=CAMNT_0042063193 /DNA_START=352 /DNA_END=516 /DNA_ORIENTATION=+
MSRKMKPSPPAQKSIPAANPSPEYCAFNRRMNTWGTTAPVLASRVCPMNGGSSL